MKFSRNLAVHVIIIVVVVVVVILHSSSISFKRITLHQHSFTSNILITDRNSRRCCLSSWLITSASLQTPVFTGAASNASAN